jgi:hypothetical protein
MKNSELSHSDFITKLKNLGFYIEVKSDKSGDNTYKLFVNGVRISTIDYSIFGYICGGVYASCNRTEKENYILNDVENAVKKCSEILMNEIISISKVPTYFDCKDFLNSNFGKTKIEKESIKRVLSLLKENYQALIKSVTGYRYYN